VLTCASLGQAWNEFWASRYDQEHAKMPHAIDRHEQQLKRGWVYPVRVLKQHQYWTLDGETLKL
jgi:hypothetical protein